MTRKANPQTPGKARSSWPLWALSVVVLIGTGALAFTRATQSADVTVYKSPACGCCGKWVEHMEQAGFTVEVQDRQDLTPIKSELGVPGGLQSCHTAKVGDYVVEGHVPADLIQRMLKEKPAIRGLAVPGMPMGSPGMEGPHKDDYEVLALRHDGRTEVYARR